MSHLFKIIMNFILLPGLIGVILSFAIRALINSLISKNYYFKHSEKALAKGFREKDLALRDGLQLHYVEGPAKGIPLLLIPGQGSLWHDYGPVLLALSEKYHVVAVDCHGHGLSSWNKEDYQANIIADDMALLIDELFHERAVVSGHSSGGLIAACLARRHPDKVRGMVLEDAPFFTTEPHRKKDTYVWVDTFQNIQGFLKQDQEKDYICYYMPRSYWRNFFGKFWNVLVKKVLQQRRADPSAIPYIGWVGPKINRIWESLSHPFDLQFSVGFIDNSFFTGFDQAQTLSQITCPSLFLKATTRFDKKRNILLAALNDDDCARVDALLPDNQVISIRSGHDIHFERPAQYIKALNEFAERVKA